MRLYGKLPWILPDKEAIYDIKNGIQVEAETGALLYGLVRVHKPRVCIETGTFIGESAYWIGKALQDNKFGTLISCDTETEHMEEARQRVKDLPVEIRRQDGRELLLNSGTMDFVFLDGGDPGVRDHQLEVLGDHNISPGGLLVWHDAVVWCQSMYNAFAPTHDWPHLILPTTVGLAIFQRPQ
jgi:predicted O-methyltransferase YrrM